MKKSTLFLWQKFVLTLLLSWFNCEGKVCLTWKKNHTLATDQQDKIL